MALEKREQVETELLNAFINHAIDNQGVLTSARHAKPVIDRFYLTASAYLASKMGEEDIYRLAEQLATQGLALTSGRALLAVLSDTDWSAELIEADALTIQSRLAAFQLHFLEALALGREEANIQEHEASQSALQHALHTQLQQQRDLQREQVNRTNSLQSILQLIAELASIQDEDQLLSQAADGLGNSLGLQDVTIYQWRRFHGWSCRVSTSDAVVPSSSVPAGLLTILNQALEDASGEVVRELFSAEQADMRIVTRIQAGPTPLGALIVHQEPYDQNLPILLQTFALNLSAIWRNLQLLLETQQRAQELEILHGRHIDSIWHTGQMMIDASYSDTGLALNRYTPEAPTRPSNGYPNIPVTVGDKPLGNLFLPDNTNLSPEDSDFVQALVREMGSALNNAHLLQTTRAYSLQLRTAVEVSRVVSTILDQERLMLEVVELIQNRFEFYFVAIYLLEDGEAVLKAGSGPAGTAMVEENYHISLKGETPVGIAIQQNRPVLERNIQQTDHPYLPYTSTQLALPLRARGDIIGVLVTDGIASDTFSDEETTVLQTLSDQIAVAIDNASLFTQVQDNFVLTNQLYQTGRQIIEAEDANTIFQAMVDFAAGTGLFDMAHLFIASPGSPDEFLATNVWTRASNLASDDEPLRIIRSRFLASSMIVSGEVVVIEDALNDERLDPATRRSFQRYGIRSATLIPIMADDKWMGTLALDRVDTVKLNEQQLQPFLSLCAQAGVALNNLQLLRETDALYRVGQSLNQALTADDALKATLVEIAGYIGLDRGRLVRYNQQSGTGRVVVALDPETGVQEVSDDNSPVFKIEEDTIFSRLSISSEPLHITAKQPLESEAAHYLQYFGVPSSVLVPILGQQILMGFLAVDGRSDEYTFGQAELNFVKNASAQLATFLENITLFEETAQRAQELILLNQVGSLLAGILDLDKLIHVLYERVGDLLDNTIFLVALYDADVSSYTPLLHIVEGSTIASAPFSLNEEDPLTHLLHSNFPLQGPDAVRLALEQHPYPQRPPLSAVWVPWQQEDNPAGLVSIQSFQPNAYTDTDTQLLRTIATQAGLAITNAQLFQQTQENVAELRTLFNVAQAGAVSVNADERISKMVYALHESLRRANVSILLYNAERSALQTLDEYPDFSLLNNEMWVDNKLAEQVARTGQALLVNNLNDLQGYDLDGPRHGSLLIIPLTLGQRVIGVIRATSQYVNAFTQRDLRLLETLSISLAATIESNRLFEEIQTANERLRELDRLKTRFLANMSHELRTPLNSIIGFSGIILKGIDGPITVDQEQDLTAINKSGQHLLMLINEILDMAKIEAGKMTLLLERIDVREVADSVLSTVRGLIDEKPVVLNWEIEPDLPLIDADQIRLRQIMLNLLSNAVKYTYEGSVTCKISQEGDFIHILVADTGIGIAEQDFDKLFRAFEQVDDSSTRSIQGTGLGLPITQSLVQMHQGEIWLESEIGKGTTFHVRLPIRSHEELTLA